MCMYITQYWKLNSLFTLLTERPRVSEELWTCVFLVLMFLVFLVCGFVRVCSAHHWSTGVFMPGGCVLPGGWLRLRTSHTCSWSGSSGELYRGVAESSLTWDHWVTLQVSESSPVQSSPCMPAGVVFDGCLCCFPAGGPWSRRGQHARGVRKHGSREHKHGRLSETRHGSLGGYGDLLCAGYLLHCK